MLFSGLLVVSDKERTLTNLSVAPQPMLPLSPFLYSNPPNQTFQPSLTSQGPSAYRVQDMYNVDQCSQLHHEIQTEDLLSHPSLPRCKPACGMLWLYDYSQEGDNMQRQWAVTAEESWKTAGKSRDWTDVCAG